MFYQLILKNISLNVKLGHLEEEHTSPQRVLVKVKLQFSTIPTACMTDNLHDTLCYAALSGDLQEFCNTRSFKLIETLGYQLYQFLKKKIAERTSASIKIFLCVTKHPSLINLRQSSFVVSE
jgi:7,8-dihydroneopterin aldolase/epimerase/oxygenase